MPKGEPGSVTEGRKYRRATRAIRRSARIPSAQRMPPTVFGQEWDRICVFFSMTPSLPHGDSGPDNYKQGGSRRPRRNQDRVTSRASRPCCGFGWEMWWVTGGAVGELQAAGG